MYRTLSRAILAALLFSCLASSLCLAHAPPNPWARVRIDAALPDAEQRTPAVQTRFQQWFMAKIRFYQNVLGDTAIGGATPRIVDLGDWTAQFNQILAPPTGRGTTTITFGTVGAPSTMDDTAEIIFPRARADTYIDDSPDTCWHEFQHTIVIMSERGGRSPAIPRSPWSIYAKPGDDKNIEHVYIEGLGEYTTEWLDLLLHERSVLTGGAAMGFEKHARDAYAQVKAYEAKNESISYAVENYCWAKAHDAYCRAWKERGHSIAPLPLQYREDYRQICGVSIGFVEEIVRFYMQGGLRTADGKPIRVPEWVMNPDPMKTGIIVGHLNETKDIANDTLRYGFDMRVMENYRIKERSDSLNHGKVLISLENPDATASLELAVDGKPIKRSPGSGKIDLAGFKKNSKIRVTFVRSKLSSFAGVKRYKILVEYQPDPRLENGVQKPSFYYPSKAIYYVDVTGSGTGTAAVATVSKTTTKPVGSTKPKTPTGIWRLEGVVKNKRFDDMFKNQPGLSGDAALSDTSIEITITQHIDERPPRTAIARSRHTWDHPGQTLTPDTKVPVTLASKDNGSIGVKNDRGALDAGLSLEAWVEHAGGGMSFGLFTHPASGGRDSNGGGISIACGSPIHSSDSFTSQLPIPDGVPGDRLIIKLSALSIPMMAEVEFHYVFEKTAASPSGKADASLTAEEAQPEPEPAGMDNEPPEPGDLVKIPKTEDKEPPKNTKTSLPAEQWYTHPSGDYKFKLSSGWKISPKHFFEEKSEEYDTLWPADEGMAIICARGYTDNGSKSGDAVLKEFTAKMLKSNPAARSERISLGDAQAARISDYGKDSGVMTWHIGMFHSGRSYFISVVMPSSTMPSKMPDPPAWMLGSMVMMR